MQKIDFYEIGQIHQRFIGIAVNEIVHGQEIPGLLQAPAGLDHLGVRLDGFQDLDDDLVFGDEMKVVLEKDVAGDVDEPPLTARQGGHVEEGEAVREDFGGRLVRVRTAEDVVEARTKQELVSVDFLMVVENRLPGDEGVQNRSSFGLLHFSWEIQLRHNTYRRKGTGIKGLYS